VPLSFNKFNCGGEVLTDDLIPIIHKFPNGQDIKVFPISDLHVGSPQFDSKKWDVFRAKLISEPHSRIVICGDMMNNGIKSSKSNCYEEVMRPAQQKSWLIEQLKPVADRILCGCSGNHEQRSVKETDQNPLYDVFVKLDIEHLYREYACFMTTRFGTDKHQHGLTRPTYNTIVTHGSGGGVTIGAAANRASRFGMAIDGADLMILGHSHRSMSYPEAKLRIDPHNNKISVQQFRVIIATSWLHYGGYPIGMMLPPTAYVLQEAVYSSDFKQIRVTS